MSYLNIKNTQSGNLDIHSFNFLESELGEGQKCFNCNFCGDIESETGNVKDAVIDCLGSQAGVNNVKLGEVCGTHEYIEDYSVLRKQD